MTQVQTLQRASEAQVCCPGLPDAVVAILAETHAWNMMMARSYQAEIGRRHGTPVLDRFNTGQFDQHLARAARICGALLEAGNHAEAGALAPCAPMPATPIASVAAHVG